VTKRSCLLCGRTFTVSGGPGRPRVYCKQSCKQRDYESRRRTEELGIGEHELVITRDELEQLRDRLYVLSCVLDDVERDRGNGEITPSAALDTLVDATRECVAEQP